MDLQGLSPCPEAAPCLRTRFAFATQEPHSGSPQLDVALAVNKVEEQHLKSKILPQNVRDLLTSGPLHLKNPALLHPSHICALFQIPG